MKFLFSTIFILITSINIYSQDIAGVWKGKLHVQGITLNIVFNIDTQNDDFVVQMDSPDQGAFGIVAKNVTFINDTLTVEFPQLMAKYIGKFEIGKVSDMFIGDWYQIGSKFELFFSKDESSEAVIRKRPQTPKPPFDYLIEEVKIYNAIAGINLAGTLTLPKGKGPFRAIVLVSGSGPQDRNGEILGHKPFWVIADFMVKKGIAVLRYDDRGVGKSEGSFDTATSADFADDAEAAFNFLRNDSRIDKRKTGIAGHSEGGIIAQIVGARNKDLGFIISLAGPGTEIDQLLMNQNKAMHLANGGDLSEIEKELNLNQNLFNILKNNDIENSRVLVSESLNDFEQSLTGVAQQQFVSTKKMVLEQLLTPWFHYFINYSPKEKLSKIKIPFLAINGGKDTQVLADENLKAIEEALKIAGNKNVKTVKFEQLNHLFQTAKTGAISEYAQIEETFSPAVMKLMAEWILSL